MIASCQKDMIPAPYYNLQFYADLSQYTLQKCRNLNTVTKAHRNHYLSYKWGFPTKPIVKDDKEYVMDSHAKGMALLQSWGIVPDPQTTPHQKTGTRGPEPEWRTVDRRNARSHN